MIAAALALWLQLTVSPSVAPMEPMTYEQRVTRLDETLTAIRELNATMRAEEAEAYRDLRGRIALDDIEQWALTPELMKQASELLEKARVPGSQAASDALDEADMLMYGAVSRANEIRDYWQAMPQLSWRDRWKAFATANGLRADAPDQGLLALEKELLASLAAGRFSGAAILTQDLDTLLIEVFNRATGEVMAKKKPGDIVFVPRTTPCPARDGTAGSATARLIQGSDPESWYPSGSKDRGEHGAIVVRAKIAESNCATAFAVMVSSGYPELDAAALKVAEASRYTAAVESGKPVAGELNFKVRFNLVVD